MHYYVDRLEGCDAFGAYTYHFNDISDKYSRITFATSLVGDANLAGRVDISDVTAIQRWLVELETFSDEQIALADANGDGEINISDATYLQMVLAQ